MTSLGGYPTGAEYDSRAPYNQDENPEIEVELLVEVSIYKKIKIKTSKYDIIDEGLDDDGWRQYSYDYSNCDFTSDIEAEIEDSLLPMSGWEIVEYDYTIING